MERSLAERLILGISAIGFFICLVMLYFFDQSANENAFNEPPLGSISPQGSQVRMRHAIIKSWKYIYQSGSVFNGDRIFTGQESKAQIFLNSNSNLTVSPNSLLVIKKSQDHFGIDLKTGSLSGLLNKNGQVVFIKNGVHSILKGKSDQSTFSVESDGHHSFKIKVNKGQVSIATITPPPPFSTPPYNKTKETKPVFNLIETFERNPASKMKATSVREEPTPILEKNQETLIDENMELTLNQNIETKVVPLVDNNPGEKPYRITLQKSPQTVTNTFNEVLVKSTSVTTEMESPPAIAKLDFINNSKSKSMDTLPPSSAFFPLQKQRSPTPIVTAKTKTDTNVESQSPTQPQTMPLQAPLPNNKETKYISKTHRNEFWLFVGLGVVLTYIQESLQSYSGGKVTSVDSPQILVSAGTSFEQGNGVEFNYKETPGKIFHGQGDSKIMETYKWKILSVDYLSKGFKPTFFENLDDRMDWRIGIQAHEFFTMLPTAMNSTSLTLETTGLLNASIGFDYSLYTHPKRHSDLWLRYQYPITSMSQNPSNEFKVNPIFSFDGGVGETFKIDHSLSLGIFWYGQFQWFSFNFKRDSSEFSGQQQFFNSAVDLRLGYEF